MQYQTLLPATLLSLLSLTSAAPAPQTTVTPGATVPWQIYNFELGCSPAGCTYAFNITGPPSTGDFPPFQTYCQGTDLQNTLVACAEPNVAGVYSNLVPTDEDGLVLVVNRYQKEVDGNEGIQSGNATAAPAGEPAYSSFVIQAKFYGEIVEN